MAAEHRGPHRPAFGERHLREIDGGNDGLRPDSGLCHLPLQRQAVYASGIDHEAHHSHHRPPPSGRLACVQDKPPLYRPDRQRRTQRQRLLSGGLRPTLQQRRPERLRGESTPHGGGHHPRQYLCRPLDERQGPLGRGLVLGRRQPHSVAPAARREEPVYATILQRTEGCPYRADRRHAARHDSPQRLGCLHSFPHDGPGDDADDEEERQPLRRVDVLPDSPRTGWTQRYGKGRTDSDQPPDQQDGDGCRRLLCG